MNIFTCKQRPGISTRPPSISEWPYSYRNAFLSSDECNNISIWKAHVKTTSPPTTHFEFQPFSPTSCSSDALSSPAIMHSYFPATRTAAATSGAWCESAPKHTSTVWLINVNTHFMRHSASTAGGIAAAFKTQAMHRTEDRNHLSHLHSVCITLSWNLETAPLFSSFLCWKAEPAHSCSTVFVLSWKENCSITNQLFTSHLFHYS